MEMIRKIIKVIRYTVFCITLICSMFLFSIYAAFTLDGYAHYEGSALTELQNDTAKKLLEFSEFPGLVIEEYSFPVVTWPDDAIVSYKMEIRVPNEEYQGFLQFVTTKIDPEQRGTDSYAVFYREGQLDEPYAVMWSRDRPCVVIWEDDPSADNSAHVLQIKYYRDLETDGGLYHYLSGIAKKKHSAKAWLLLFPFLLILFVNSLIILPYKRIFGYLYRKLKPYWSEYKSLLGDEEEWES